jgi:hypothetical protein
VKPNSVEIAFVGRDRKFTILGSGEIASYLDRLKDFHGGAERMDIEGAQ